MRLIGYVEPDATAGMVRTFRNSYGWRPEPLKCSAMNRMKWKEIEANDVEVIGINRIQHLRRVAPESIRISCAAPKGHQRSPESTIGAQPIGTEQLLRNGTWWQHHWMKLPAAARNNSWIDSGCRKPDTTLPFGCCCSAMDGWMPFSSHLSAFLRWFPIGSSLLPFSFFFNFFYLIWFFWLNGPWFIVTFTSSLFLLFRFIVMIVYYCWFVLPFDGWDRVTCFDFHLPFIVRVIANSIANANICVCPHVANPTLNLFNLNRLLLR